MELGHNWRVLTPAPRDGIVIVVGSINMDLVFAGLADLPIPGQTVSARNFQTLPGGKGANQASAAAAVGARVQLIAAAGIDSLGDAALVDLAARGVGLQHVKRVQEPTGVAAVLIENSGENIVIIAAGANATVAPSSVTAAETLELHNVVVLACLEIPVDTVLAWARVSRERGWTFILNPAPAQSLPVELLELVDVITPNETELAPLGTAAELLARGIRAVIVTLGEDGARLHTASGEHHQAAFACVPVDTTGAGDAFNGALAAAIAEGQSIQHAVEFAAAVGARATEALGARNALPTRADAVALLEAQRP